MSDMLTVLVVVTLSLTVLVGVMASLLLIKKPAERYILGAIVSGATLAVLTTLTKAAAIHALEEYGEVGVILGIFCAIGLLIGAGLGSVKKERGFWSFI